jgi:hypothetical protein
MVKNYTIRRVFEYLPIRASCSKYGRQVWNKTFIAERLHANGEAIMGQYSLRLPDSILKASKELAVKENTSMNQLFATVIAEKISALKTEDVLRQRALQSDIVKARRALSKIPVGKVLVGDEIKAK